MKLDSFYGKAVTVLIALSAFIIPAGNTTPEAENAYEQAAYQELLAAMPSAAPTEEPVPTEIPAPLDRAGSAALPTAAAAATMLPTFAPTNAPTYTLPMDTYAGGYAPDETAYYTQSDIFLPDGSTTTAECYKDPSIEAVSYTWRAYESDCHIVRIKLSHASQLRTATSKESVGSSTATTSSMARAKNALIAISGEYYSQREGSVFIVKQSQILKSKPSRSLHQLIIDTDGNFHITTSRSDSEAMVAELQGRIYQAFSFGPALVIDGVKTEYSDYPFDADSENPRMAIGQLGPLEYIVCAVDGRTDWSRGVTDPQLADIMEKLGCQNAYNLDGGGSTTLYWHGNVVNRVNYSGSERDISDCVYFASAYQR